MIDNVRLQPLVLLDDNSLHGYEVLSNFICEIGKYPSALDILKMVLKKYQEIDFSLFVNLNVEDLIDPGFCKSFLSLLDKFECPGSNIVLEVSENTKPECLNKAKKSLLRLKKSGVRIALDDFGTQYSTLSFMNELPIDIVKIDQSFIQKAPRNSKTMTLLEHSIRLSHEIGCEVVAEGIETPEQLDCVTSAGADFGQGFIFNYRKNGSQKSPFIYLTESIEKLLAPSFV